MLNFKTIKVMCSNSHAYNDTIRKYSNSYNNWSKNLLTYKEKYGYFVYKEVLTIELIPPQPFIFINKLCSVLIDIFLLNIIYSIFD